MILDWYRDQSQRCRRRVLSLLEKNQDARVIDLGCGNGMFTAEIGKAIGSAHLYGVNIEANHCREAEDRSINALCADLNNPLPLKDESFDVVHVHEVMEELYATDTFVKEIYRMLKYGGYAVLTLPNMASIHNVFFLCMGWQPTTAHVSDKVLLGNPYNRGGRISEHRANVRSYTYYGLKELFEYYGFKVERIVGIGYFMFPNKISPFMSAIDPRHSNRLIIKVRKNSR
ncbi:MAG: class I SAM-dependent methyltransferase [Chloroflexota bacterium]